MSTQESIDAIAERFSNARKAYTGFLHNVVDFFGNHNSLLKRDGKYIIHSVKFRIKEDSHIKEKIARKIADGRDINSENVLSNITDFCGVRILHLRLSDFDIIHDAISKHISEGHWVPAEQPKAYTWDPEYKNYFEEKGINTELKPSFYTSVHYLVKPNSESKVCCEIQVRTLFEEIWGEVDHELNYPKETDSVAQREQLKVLAKLVGAGTKLVDSIYKS